MEDRVARGLAAIGLLMTMLVVVALLRWSWQMPSPASLNNLALRVAELDTVALQCSNSWSINMEDSK